MHSYRLWSGGGLGSSSFVLTAKIMLGFTAGHLYFIVVLVQLTLLTPLMVWMIRSGWRWAGLAVTPAYIVALYGYTFVTGDLPTGYGHPFAAWFVFYYVGLWVRVRGVPRIIPGAAGTVWTAAVALSVGEAYALLALDMPAGLAASQLKLSSIVASLGFVALVLALQSVFRGAVPDSLVAVGRQSYGIYYCHMAWIIALNWIATRLGVYEGVSVLPAIQLVQVVIVLAASVATIQAGRRMLGSQRASTLLGF